MSEETFIDIVFEGQHGPEGLRFVEVENQDGRSVVFGRWVTRDDGYTVLRLIPHKHDLLHCHAAGTMVGKDIDECAICGQDLRASIHSTQLREAAHDTP